MKKCIKNCYEELVNSLEYNNIKVRDLSYKPHRIISKSKNIMCSTCGCKLEFGDYYLKNEEEIDNFIQSATDELAYIISSEIETCSHCEGNDVEYYIYKYNKEFDEDGLEMGNKGRSIEDLLYDFSIDEEYFDEILKKLQCQNCNYGSEPYDHHNPDGGYFELADRAYTRQELDNFWGINISELQKMGEKYGIIFNEEEFAKFVDFLWDKPMLGYKDDTGKKIYELLKNIYENMECETLLSESILFRGRTRKEDKPDLTDKEMWNPPNGITSHGRYNLVGISVLYCAKTISILPYEIHAGLDDIVEIAEFKLKEDMKILDIDKVFESFDGFFNSNDVESTDLKKKYLLPNYIRDCCKEIGYNGISYRSVHDELCINYALINFEKDKNIELVSHTKVKFEISYRKLENNVISPFSSLEF